MLDEHTLLTYNQSNLKLDFTVTDTLIDSEQPVVTRHVVRGIVIKDDKLLVVYPKNEPIYGTPGGGIEDDESKEQALKRELLEEVGAKEIKIIEYLGTMNSYRVDYHKPHTFNPIHHYYLVEVLEFGTPELIEYEQELELQNGFINIDSLIKQNQQAIQDRNQAFRDFYANQTQLFIELKKLQLFT